MTPASIVPPLRRILPAPATAAIRRVLLRRKPMLHSVETPLVSHCNLRCRGCNAFAPLGKGRFAEPAVWDADIHRLAELVPDVERVGIVGGEPLLHPDVMSFLRSARDAYPDAKVEMVSNGILLPAQTDAFWEELAAHRVHVTLSAYPIAVNRAAMGRRAEAHGVTLSVTEERNEFWTFPVRRAGDCDAGHSFEQCREVTNCPALVKGRLYTCGRVPVSPILARETGWDLPISERDYVDIHEETDGYRIMEFLTRPVAWCRFCDVDAVRSFPWGQAPCIDDWVQET